MKKGAGASPLFELTPQKPAPSRGSGPATPGSQSHVLGRKRAIVVPAIATVEARSEVFDLQVFTNDPGPKPLRNTLKFYKISQNNAQMSTFFGSIPSEKLRPGARWLFDGLNIRD
jgi:hypothetical protein